MSSTAHGDQKRSVTFTESPGQQPVSGPGAAEPPAEGRKSSPAPSKSPTLEVSPAPSATVTADLHGPAANIQVGHCRKEAFKNKIKSKSEEKGPQSSIVAV